MRRIINTNKKSKLALLILLVLVALFFSLIIASAQEPENKTTQANRNVTPTMDSQYEDNKMGSENIPKLTNDQVYDLLKIKAINEVTDDVSKSLNRQFIVFVLIFLILVPYGGYKLAVSYIKSKVKETVEKEVGPEMKHALKASWQAELVSEEAKKKMKEAIDIAELYVEKVNAINAKADDLIKKVDWIGEKADDKSDRLKAELSIKADEFDAQFEKMSQFAIVVARASNMDRGELDNYIKQFSDIRHDFNEKTKKFIENSYYDVYVWWSGYSYKLLPKGTVEKVAEILRSAGFRTYVHETNIPTTIVPRLIPNFPDLKTDITIEIPTESSISYFNGSKEKASEIRDLMLSIPKLEKLAMKQQLDGAEEPVAGNYVFIFLALDRIKIAK